MREEDTESAMNDEERYANYLQGGTLDDTLDDGARAELDELRRLLATSSTWDEPPPELADDIVAGIRAEAREATPPATRHRRTWMRPVLTVAAATVGVLAVALGAVLVTGDGDDDSESFALAATDVIPDATGSATVESTGSGLSISLTIEGLPPAEPGTFYQAWMRSDTDSVPIGTFHARGGDGPIELWSGVEIADYPTMTVTVQEEGAGPESSGIVVLRGDIPPP